MSYHSIGSEKARLLWRVGYGQREVDGVITIPDTHMLQCLDRAHTRELSVVFGGPCIVLREALSQIHAEFSEWISCGSLVLIFNSALIPQLKGVLVEVFGDTRPMYSIKCQRADVAAAIRGYRRRRDELLAAKRAETNPVETSQ